MYCEFVFFFLLSKKQLEKKAILLENKINGKCTFLTFVNLSRNKLLWLQRIETMVSHLQNVLYSHSLEGKVLSQLFNFFTKKMTY